MSSATRVCAAASGDGMYGHGRRWPSAAAGQGVRSENRKGPMHPFKMGLQSYSLRGYTRDGRPDVPKALAVTKELGIHYWESYTDHVPMTADPQQLAERKRQLEAADVTVIGYGVVPSARTTTPTAGSSSSPRPWG